MWPLQPLSPAVRASDPQHTWNLPTAFVRVLVPTLYIFNAARAPIYPHNHLWDAIALPSNTTPRSHTPTRIFRAH